MAIKILRSAIAQISGDTTQRAFSAWISNAVCSQILHAQAGTVQAQLNEQRKRALIMVRGVINRLKHKKVMCAVAVWRKSFEHAKNMKQWYRIKVNNAMKQQSGLRVASQILRRWGQTIASRCLQTWLHRCSSHAELHLLRCQSQYRETKMHLARQQKGAKLLQQTFIRIVKQYFRDLVTSWNVNLFDSKHFKTIQGLQQMERCSTMGTGVKLLRQIMSRMARGEVGMRLMLWKSEFKAFARLLQQTGSNATLEKERRKGLGLAMKQLRQILTRRTKGEIGMRLVVWQGLKKEFEQQQHEAAVMALRAAERDKATSAALKQMMQIMVRQLKGEAAMRLVVWRGWLAEYRDLQHRAAQRRIKEAAKEMQMGAGIKQMGQIMARMVKGELGMRLVVWKGLLLDYKIKCEEEQKRFAIALGQLRQVMARLAKGEVAMRLILWCSKLKDFDKHIVVYKQKRHEADLKSRAAVQAAMRKATGMKQLKFFMARMVKGELGMRLIVWNTRLVDYKIQQEVVAKALIEAQARSASMNAGIKQMGQIMARMVKGELGMRLVVWKGMLVDYKIQQEMVAKALIEAQARSASMNAGIKQMGQIMARMVKGELGMRLVVWKGMWNDFKVTVREAEQSSASGRESGLRIMRAMMKGWAKAAVVQRITCWRATMAADKAEKEAAAGIADAMGDAAR